MTLIASIFDLLPGYFILQVCLVIIFLAFGISKFKRYEQEAVKALVSTHPVLKHGPRFLGMAGFAMLLGIAELTTAAFLLVGIVFAPVALAGGVLGVLTFLVTLSLLPFVQYFNEEAGKNVSLLARAVST